MRQESRGLRLVCERDRQNRWIFSTFVLTHNRRPSTSIDITTGNAINIAELLECVQCMKIVMIATTDLGRTDRRGWVSATKENATMQSDR